MQNKVIEFLIKNAANIGKIGLVMIIQSILSESLRKASSSTRDEAIKAARRLYNNIREKRNHANA